MLLQRVMSDFHAGGGRSVDGKSTSVPVPPFRKVLLASCRRVAHRAYFAVTVVFRLTNVRVSTPSDPKSLQLSLLVPSSCYSAMYEGAYMYGVRQLIRGKLAGTPVRFLIRTWSVEPRDTTETTDTCQARRARAGMRSSLALA